MKLIKPSYEIAKQGSGLIGMYKQIELCGRISHKSEDSITEDSYIAFIEKMKKLKHFATFEHGTIYMLFDSTNEHWEILDRKYSTNKYTKVRKLTKVLSDHSLITYDYVTTNYRVICENCWEDDLKYICDKPTQWHEKRMTVIFTCDIGVSREYNRHRVDSILEESTRYCNYTKDKFGGELNVMLPVWLEERQAWINKLVEDDIDFIDYCQVLSENHDEDPFVDIDYWYLANLCSEYCYNKLVKDFKWTPQQARTILPLDTKTTLAHTAFMSDWNHFFDLRARGTTGAPHPSAKQLAEPLMHEIQG